MDLRTPFLNRLIDVWLEEDLGRGDLAALAVKDISRSAHWISKESGVFCGGPLVEKIFHRLDRVVSVKALVGEGETVSLGQKILEVNGPATALLSGERTALNIAMRLSGIATATAALVAQLDGTGVRLVDTRKTTPGLRLLEKYAVRCGGGLNHRCGLDDAAMLKENYLAWAGEMESAVTAVRANAPWPVRIIVEVETVKEAEEAVLTGVDGILLDNFTPKVLHDLVPKLRQLAQDHKREGKFGQLMLEASGIAITDLKKFANTGVDLISTSAPVTRSSWLDFSMRFDPPI